MSTLVGSAVVVPRNVARAVVIKSQDVFFVSEQDGGLPLHDQDGFGLYYHDCRYLDGYEIRIAGTHMNSLIATADRGSVAEFKLTNDELKLNGHTVPAQTFGIALQRTIDGERLVVHDQYTISNYDLKEHELPLSLRVQADFEDIFVIRGMHAKEVGNQNRPKWQHGVLFLI